jgi:antitoxin component YwqK of YwqJK toxin-antitoxin module
MSEINQLNKDGKRHGLWEICSFNGLFRYKGTYVNGKHHGLWKHYHYNSERWEEGIYVNDKKYGLWEHYNKDGTIKKQVFYSKELDVM